MIKDGFYYFEPFTEHFSRAFKTDSVCFEGRTAYQEVHCFQNSFLGKVLFLDRKIQSAECDEFIYHESLIHPGFVTAPFPKRVLILGGGEGAALREILKHDPIEAATMVDIDRDLVAICKNHLQEWSNGAFDHPKTQLVFDDARKFIQETEEKYDVIVSDLTEPVEEGPSIPLFTREFFFMIQEKLTDQGLFILQAGSTDTVYNRFFTSCCQTLKDVFRIVRPYWNFMMSFGLPWGFVVASDQIDPLTLEEDEIGKRLTDRGVKPLKYYHTAFHKGMFVLPRYLQDDMKKGRILTDKDPFIWKA